MQQLSLFQEPIDLEEWTSDDWQTPNQLAQKLANLVEDIPVI